MTTLRWLRVPGDILFALGAALFAWFVLGLLTGHSYDDEKVIGKHTTSRGADEEREAALAGR
jgi:nitric oxide reductase subunit B